MAGVGALVTVVAVIFAVAVGMRYALWRSRTLAALEEGTEVAKTAKGDVQYVLRGSEGPMVLFVHGSPGGSDSGPSPRAGTRMLTPSRPGYLRTPLGSGRSPAEQADLYAALLDDLAIDSVIVMAASGGGPSAFHFAVNHPDRCRALIAIETVAKSMPLEPVPAPLRADLVSWWLLSVLTLPGLGGMVRRLIVDEQVQQRVMADPQMLRRFEQMLWSTWPPSQRMRGHNNDAERFVTLDLPLERIQAPTLIVHGKLDTSVPFEHAELLKSKVPHAVVVAFEDGDHFMPCSHATELTAAVQDFVAGLP